MAFELSKIVSRRYTQIVEVVVLRVNENVIDTIDVELFLFERQGIDTVDSCDV